MEKKLNALDKGRNQSLEEDAVLWRELKPRSGVKLGQQLLRKLLSPLSFVVCQGEVEARLHKHKGYVYFGVCVHSHRPVRGNGEMKEGKQCFRVWILIQWGFLACRYLKGRLASIFMSRQGDRHFR